MRKLIFAVIVLLAATVSGDTLGVKSETFVDYWGASPRMFFTVGTSGSAGTLDSLWVWVYNMDNDSLYLKGALYDHSVDNAFVDSTTWRRIAQTEDEAWIGMAFVAGASISASTNYRMAVWARDAPSATNGRLRDINGGWGFHFIKTAESNRLDVPWPATTDSTDFVRGTSQTAIYVVYTASAGGDISYIRRIKEGENK